MTTSITAPAPAASVAAIADALLKVLTEKYEAPAETTTADTKFELLGFDSLILVEVAVDLSRQFGTEVTDSELHEAGTAANAARVLADRGVRV